MKDIIQALIIGCCIVFCGLVVSSKLLDLQESQAQIEQALADRVSGPTTIQVERGNIYLTLPEGKFELTANSIGLVEMYDPKKKGGK